MRGTQLARQWKIIRLLEARTRGVGCVEMAEELEVSVRTVYRDLVALQEAGFPLITEKDGKNVLWMLGEEFRKHFSLPLTSAELMALSLSRDILGIFEGTIFCDGIETLFQKVRSSQSPANRTRLETFSATLRHQVVPSTDFSKIQAILKRLSCDKGAFETVKTEDSVFNDGGDLNEKISDNVCPRLTHIGGTLCQ
jgi:predicted DNA-binding transcriptional regulator YafY